MIALGRTLLPILLVAQLHSPQGAQALPRRLVLFLDGIAYRDVCALQQGVTGRDGQYHRCFEAFFPASRVVSTYPSASDVASTDIFGNRPLPGYQRTYYSYAANATMFVNAVTSAVEFERQMHWLLPRGWPYAMSFVAPVRSLKGEIPDLISAFLTATNVSGTFYGYTSSTDNAQHLSRDILQLLCDLDRQLAELRATYRAREGRELEVLVFSDHGNNHTRSERVKVRPFLKRAGYRIAKSLERPGDVILPTAGIESWVEIHNHPSETESLLALLSQLPGVDILTAKDPGTPTSFVVMNSRRERASIDWHPARNSFRYRPQIGDPLGYCSVVQRLKRDNRLDAEGFGDADAWLRETVAHFYPVALERIVHGHTQVTLNPASIILSLNTNYVHANFWIKAGSGLVNCGGTHGGLNALDSIGVVLSSFGPTTDTTTARLAGFYDRFEGLRDYRAVETGAELFSPATQALVAIPRVPLDRNYMLLDPTKLYLRVWSPLFTESHSGTPIEVTVRPAIDTRPIHIRRSDPKLPPLRQLMTLNAPVEFPEHCPYERVYAFPPEAALEPGKAYWLSGRLGSSRARLFELGFRTDAHARPVAY